MYILNITTSLSHLRKWSFFSIIKYSANFLSFTYLNKTVVLLAHRVSSASVFLCCLMYCKFVMMIFVIWSRELDACIACPGTCVWSLAPKRRGEGKKKIKEDDMVVVVFPIRKCITSSCLQNVDSTCSKGLF